MPVRARVRRVVAVAVVALAVAASADTSPNAAAALPPGNTVAQWNNIAEDTVAGSGALQSKGWIYIAYVSAAVHDAMVAIRTHRMPTRSEVGASTTSRSCTPSRPVERT
jgi:hypothetical protein